MNAPFTPYPTADDKVFEKNANYTIRLVPGAWQVVWHRFGNETSRHPTLHDAEFAAERVYGSPLAHLKAGVA